MADPLLFRSKYTAAPRCCRRSGQLTKSRQPKRNRPHKRLCLKSPCLKSPWLKHPPKRRHLARTMHKSKRSEHAALI